MKWKPISTAPEGRTVLVWNPHFGVPTFRRLRDGVWWGGEIVMSPLSIQDSMTDEKGFMWVDLPEPPRLDGLNEPESNPQDVA